MENKIYIKPKVDKDGNIDLDEVKKEVKEKYEKTQNIPALQIFHSYLILPPRDVIDSFMFNIIINLENDNLGSKFPYFMQKFMNENNIKYEDLNYLLNEIVEIEEKLDKISIEKFIWNWNNRELEPPLYLSPTNKNKTLADYFREIGEYEQDLFSIYTRAIKKALNFEENLKRVALSNKLREELTVVAEMNIMGQKANKEKLEDLLSQINTNIRIKIFE